MKTAFPAMLTVLSLFLSVTAQAQSQARPGISGPQGSNTVPALTRPPHPTRPPSLVRPQFFGHHPAFFGTGLFVPTRVAAAPSTYVYTYPTPVYVPVSAYGPLQAQLWAYCGSPRGYYPYVADCPSGWLPVLPTSTPPPTWISGDTERDPKQARAGAMPIEELRERIARSRAD
jgi:hypothetical protein